MGQPTVRRQKIYNKEEKVQEKMGGPGKFEKKGGKMGNSDEPKILHKKGPKTVKHVLPENTNKKL